MKETNNFIPDLYLNQFKNHHRNLRKELKHSYFGQMLSNELKNFKIKRTEIKEELVEKHNINISFHYAVNEMLKYELFYIDIRFYIFQRTLKMIADDLKLDERTQLELINFEFISNKNIINPSKEITVFKLVQILYSNFIDYIFHSLILLTQKKKYKKSNFEQFIKLFNPILVDPELNISFRTILKDFFDFIDQFFIKKEFNDIINFSKDNKSQNLYIMKDYNEYFNNTMENVTNFFETIEFSYIMQDFLEKFNSHEIFFNSLIKDKINHYNHLFCNLLDDNYSREDDNDFSTTFKKTVGQILSNKEHYLTFIYNMNISEINNKKYFPLLFNALRDGIFFDVLFSTFLKKYRKEKINNFSKNNHNVVFKIINIIYKDYDPRFNNLTILFISHYIGLSLNQSYNFADNLNTINNKNNASENTIHKKTYQKYYKKTKKHILDLKHEIGNLIIID